MMINNFLVTGPPGSGKTFVVERAMSILREHGLRAGGIYCPDIRKDGIRIGFRIVDVMTGDERILARVGHTGGPRVGKYQVNIAGLDEISGRAIERAIRKADFVVVDEIAPMEIYSIGFRRAVIAALDSRKPTMAVVHQRSKTGFIGDVKKRNDVKIFEVTRSTREILPYKLAELVLECAKL